MLNKLICSTTTLLFSASLLFSTENVTKQERWDAFAEEVAHWADAVGNPIDAGVMDAVIALNLLDIQTHQSCEGHRVHGFAYPWVSFTVGPKELLAEQDECLQQSRKLREILNTYYSDLSKQEKQLTAEGQKLKQLQQNIFDNWDKIDAVIQKDNLMRPLLSLLDAFYETHECNDDERLVVDFFVVASPRLQSAGAHLQSERSESEKVAKLVAYRKEMYEFSQFLKKTLI